MDRGAGGLQSIGSQRVRYNWTSNYSTDSISLPHTWRDFKEWGVEIGHLLNSIETIIIQFYSNANNSNKAKPNNIINVYHHRLWC